MNYKLFSLVSGTLILSSLSASGQKNNTKPNKNHSGNKNKDKHGKKDRQYFRTTIENGGTVTKADYSYQI